MKVLCVLMCTISLVYSAPKTVNVATCINDVIASAIENPAGDFTDFNAAKEAVTAECAHQPNLLKCHKNHWSNYATTARKTIPYLSTVLAELSKCAKEDGKCMTTTIHAKDSLFDDIKATGLRGNVNLVYKECDGITDPSRCAVDMFSAMKSDAKEAVAIYKKIKANIKTKCAAH